MKNILYIFITTAAILYGCNKYDESFNEAKTYSILAVVENSIDTKTVVDNVPSNIYPDARIGILWNHDDKIGVYSASTLNSAFSSDMIAGTVASSALFSGTLNDNALYAYFPYSADNNNVEANAVRGVIPEDQEYDIDTRRIPADYKIGVQRKDANGTPIAGSFSFTSILSLLRVDIDATQTVLAGEQLQKIILIFPENNKARGNLTINLETQETSITSGSNTLNMVWSGSPNLTAGKQYTGYITCAPMKFAADETGTPATVTVSIETSGHIASFNATLSTDFAPNTMYTFPLKLSKWAEKGAAVNWSVSDKSVQ